MLRSKNQLKKKPAPEPVVKEEVPVEKQPSWWQTVKNTVSSWFKEAQVNFYEWMGNQEKVIQIRGDLDTLYSNLGRVLDKAKNNKSAFYVEEQELSNRIGKGIQTLKDYQDALVKGAITEQEKENVKAEIQDIATDLLILKEQFQKESLDQETRDSIDNQIYQTLKDFGLSDEEIASLQEKTAAAAAEPEKPLEPTPEEKSASIAAKKTLLDQKVNDLQNILDKFKKSKMGFGSFTVDQLVETSNEYESLRKSIKEYNDLVPKAKFEISPDVDNIGLRIQNEFKRRAPYYEILGVTPPSTTKEISSAFKKLAVNQHPDKVIAKYMQDNFVDENSVPKEVKDKATEDFQKITDARDKLIPPVPFVPLEPVTPGG